MECAKWEEIGLLFTSNELDVKEQDAFRSHLEECSACREEYDGYVELKSQFAPHESLQAEPSEATNQEILRVCSNPTLKTTSLPLFSSVLKKGLVSAVFLLAGFMGTGYFVFVMNDASNTQKVAEEFLPSENAAVSSSSVAALPGSLHTASIAPSSDSSRDSSLDTDVRPFSETVGSLDETGVRSVGFERD